VRLSRLEEEPEAALYVPFTQRATNVMSVALKTRVPPGSLVGPLREALQKLDPEVPLTEVATVPELVYRSLADRRVLTLTLSLFALLPLVLAAVGLFAVLAYHVSRRRHEIGVRMALGASPAGVLGMFVRRAMLLAAAGAAVGALAAAALAGVLEQWLVRVSPRDPLTYAAVAGVLCLVALGATYWPARRAAATDPIATLRCE
jgi:putative ABC transport system permease protein